MSYTFHVIGLPHTQTIRAYSNCAFTENVRKFCAIVQSLGHYVILYSSEDNEAPCDEHVQVISKAEQRELCGVDGPETVLNAKYEAGAPHWQLFNQRVIESMRPRVSERDFLASIAGDLNQPVINAFPQLLPIEYAVGYTGIAHNTKCAFASSAWMHTIYGHRFGAHGTRGRFYDRVIPHFIDPGAFSFTEERDDYFLFVGRLNEDKGIGVAAETCRRIGARLIAAGIGDYRPEGPEYVGLVGPEERARLMSRARGLFVPSLYLEPFGMVAIEGLVSGCPLITTDWGGLAEINNDGVGFRCNTLKDFVSAARSVGRIDSYRCRARALGMYSLDAVTPQYAKWFDDLYGLWGAGWYAS